MEAITNLLNELLYKDSYFLDDIYIEIKNINEIEYHEYLLSLKIGENIILDNIYINIDKKISVGHLIQDCEFSLFQNNSFVYLKIDEVNFKSNKHKKKIEQHNNSIITKVDLGPNNLVNFYANMFQKKYYEDIFIFQDIVEQKINLISPINSKKYYIDVKYIPENLRVKDKIIYIKNYLIQNDEILCNNLTIVKLSDDYETFNLLESRVNQESNESLKEIKSILGEEKVKIECLVGKVVLKVPNPKQLKIIDTFDRIIELDFESFKYLDLFDILFITNCEIQKSKNDEYTYNLSLLPESFKYYSKNLYFDKRIKLNNYTLLDIYYNDFCANNNLYNTIIINESNINISKEHQIYKFYFKNEPFNEIVPFQLSIKNDNSTDSFKFLITHNIINKVNILINNNIEKKCCLGYYYQNLFEEMSLSSMPELEYPNLKNIQCNSFDTLNRINYIMINVPFNKDINSIKDFENENIISCRLCFDTNEDAYKNKKENYYQLIQILNINEAKPIIYSNYDFSSNNYSIFEDFYFNFTEKRKEKDFDIINYYNEFSKNVINYEEIYDLLRTKLNIEFLDENLNYLSLKIYIGISFFDALVQIETENKNEKLSLKILFRDFVDYFDMLIKKVISKKNKFTYHQKMRVINCFIYNYFHSSDKIKKNIKLIFFDEMEDEYSYKMAFNFNINIIKNLTETSTLTQGFLQLDSYILTNYLIKNNNSYSKSYTLTDEPLVMMNFLFIIYENSYKNYIKNASQDKPNRITNINEKALFNSNNSEKLFGKDNALPISSEFFHEKDSHSKKNLKNLHLKSPIICYINNKIDILSEPEDGRFIESILGNKEFIKDLKNPNKKLGELMNVDYFTKNNFEELHKKYDELTVNQVSNQSAPVNKIADNDEIKNPDSNEPKNNKNKNSELITCKDFEDFYLINGCFVYPDSLPFHHNYYGEEPEKISVGEKEYLDKYKNIIKEAREAHYGRTTENN